MKLIVCFRWQYITWIHRLAILSSSSVCRGVRATRPSAPSSSRTAFTRLRFSSCCRSVRWSASTWPPFTSCALAALSCSRNGPSPTPFRPLHFVCSIRLSICGFALSLQCGTLLGFQVLNLLKIAHRSDSRPLSNGRVFARIHI